MHNEITIDPKEILTLPNGSITDPETIRQIALYGIKHNDSSLDCKIKKEFTFSGLYPHIMQSLDTNQVMLPGVLYGESSTRRNNHILIGIGQGIQPTIGENYKRKPFSGGLPMNDIFKKTRAIGMTEVTGVKPSTNDIVKQLLIQTPLETRLKVSIEMTFMQMLVELGFISDRPRDDESEEDNRILKVVLDTAEKEAKYLAKQVEKWQAEKWQADGMPEEK